jgi:hypothetical protein
VTLIAAKKDSQPRVVEAPEAVCPRFPLTDDTDGIRLVSGPNPGGIRFWSVTAIAPDLRTVASVAPDASIAIWEMETRKIIQKLPAPKQVAIMDAQSCGLRHLAFSPNGLRLACTTIRGEIIFWQLAQAVSPKEETAKAKPAMRITGRVIDAESGRPIANCRMIPASVYRDDSDTITWQSQYLKNFTDGRYLYETDRPRQKMKLRIEADGYRPAITRVVNKSEKSVELDVKLVRETYRGVVRMPNGQPAVNAQLAIATWTNEIKVQSSKLTYFGHASRLRKVVESDALGRFELPAEIDTSVLVVAHKSGYAEVRTVEPSATEKAREGVQPGAPSPPRDNQALEITLQPWGRVEGRVLMGETPVVGAKYWVYQARTDNVHVRAHHNVETDANGRFVVQQIPPGAHGICQRYAENSDGKGSHSMAGLVVRFEIPPGKTAALELGGRGRTLIGKLVLPTGFPYKVDWSKVSLQVALQAPRFRSRLGGSNEAGISWSNFRQTEEGKLYRRDQVTIAADGSFRIKGLPAAEYQLTVNASGEAVVDDPKPDGVILRATKKFAVPAAASSDAPASIELGAITLTSRLAANNAQAAPENRQAAITPPAAVD